MTQYQQVLAALKALGGAATAKAIYDKIKETAPEWKTKTPVASVAAYLSTGDDFKKGEDGVWTLQDVSKQDDSDDGNDDADGKQQKADDRGLYFITLSPYIKICGAGFLFKIGQSDAIKNRLNAYSASLPMDTIQVISYYPIPSEIDLAEAERNVNGALKGNEHLGEDAFGRKITVRSYFNGHQKEWLQTLDVKSDSLDDLNCLASVIDEIVRDTIHALTPKIEGEETDE